LKFGKKLAMPPLGNEKKNEFSFFEIRNKNFHFEKKKNEIFHLCHQENFEMIFLEKNHF
jgi:hypothetical protein